MSMFWKSFVLNVWDWWACFPCMAKGRLIITNAPLAASKIKGKKLIACLAEHHLLLSQHKATFEILFDVFHFLVKERQENERKRCFLWCFFTSLNELCLYFVFYCVAVFISATFKCILFQRSDTISCYCRLFTSYTYQTTTVRNMSKVQTGSASIGKQALFPHPVSMSTHCTAGWNL